MFYTDCNIPGVASQRNAVPLQPLAKLHWLKTSQAAEGHAEADRYNKSK
jgi:hypothetical protein